MKLYNFCSKVIEYSFYLIFFLVPLALAGDTSELFEFNKLWLTFILTIVIGFAWFTKMVIRKQFRIQKTPLDIPIGLFLVSQIISSFISLDTHISLWGYYSRFNGGLFSIFAYVFLYYAFVSNLANQQVDEKEQSVTPKRILIFLGAILAFAIGAAISSKIQNAPSAGTPFQLIATLITALVSFAIFMKAAPLGIIKRSLYAIFTSSILVVLWGLPSHFGYDPTCLLFRGTLDVSCWTSSFQPKVRMFSTLGQPDWTAAYLGALLPILSAIFINFAKSRLNLSEKLSFLKNTNLLLALGLGLFFLLAYVSLLFTVSRSAIFGFWVSIIFLLGFYFWFGIKPNLKSKALDFKAFVTVILIIGVVTFIIGAPFNQLRLFSLNAIKEKLFAQPTTSKTVSKSNTPAAPTFATELGGTDSGIIRSYVWKGAIDIWKNYPVFGSGVETFAFAYYKFRPIGHNTTSEWNYLYNKAHNEFLNYLATTGTVGILTYLSIIGLFLFLTLRYLFRKRNNLTQKDFLIASFVAAYLVILITNFIGFSVVIINIFFFLFPAFVFVLAGFIDFEKGYVLRLTKNEIYTFNLVQKISVAVLALASIYLISYLINFWNSDRNYYFGLNFDQAQDYQRAYPFLQKAVNQTPNEPVFKDEFAFNNAVLGAAILSQSQGQQQQSAQNTQIAKQLIDTGINTTNQVTTEHPNNIVFWKTKVRIYYTLAQIDPSYYAQALSAIKTSALLAPSDPDVFYNLGVLYGQTGDGKNAVAALQKTIMLKPDYKGGQAYYALGIFYRQLAVDSKGKLVNEDYNQKAIDEMKLMEKLFGKNQQADDALKAWGASQ